MAFDCRSAAPCEKDNTEEGTSVPISLSRNHRTSSATGTFATTMLARNCEPVLLHPGFRRTNTCSNLCSCGMREGEWRCEAHDGQDAARPRKPPASIDTTPGFVLLTTSRNTCSRPKRQPQENKASAEISLTQIAKPNSRPAINSTECRGIWLRSCVIGREGA